MRLVHHLLLIASSLFVTSVLAAAPLASAATTPTPAQTSADRIREELATGFMRNMVALAEDNRDRLAENFRRVKALQVAELTTAATLTSPAAVAAGQVKLAELRTLEAEKLIIAGEFEARVRRLLTPEVVTGMGPARLNELNSNFERMRRKEAQLASARENAAKALEQLLEWTRRQEKPMQEKDGKLVMASNTQRADYTMLIGRFIEAAQSESPLVKDQNLDSAKAQEKYEEAKEMLRQQK
jgi:hypothetical protein